MHSSSLNRETQTSQTDNGKTMYGSRIRFYVISQNGWSEIFDGSSECHIHRWGNAVPKKKLAGFDQKYSECSNLIKSPRNISN